MAIGPLTRAPLMVLPEPPKVDANAQSDDVDASAAAMLNQFAQKSDEMSASLMTQFRSRRSFEANSEVRPGDFEKVLDDDAVPKAKQIVALAAMTDKPVSWLLQMAKGLFPDDSDLVLVLRELLRQKQLPEATRQRLEQLLQTAVLQAPPKRLKAGINCALKARLFGKTLGLRAGIMRETYRSFLEAEEGPVECYEDWVSVYGYRHRATVLAFIEAALLTDIDSLDPSCSLSEFGELCVKLAQLKRLRSADEAFIATLLTNELMIRIERQEPDLLVFLFGLLRYPDALDELLDDVFSASILLISHTERSMVLQLLRSVCLRLPAELFPDAGALESLATRFSQLADISHAHELIERRKANET